MHRKLTCIWTSTTGSELMSALEYHPGSSSYFPKEHIRKTRQNFLYELETIMNTLLTSRIFTNNRMASVDTMFPSPFQLDKQKQEDRKIRRTYEYRYSSVKNMISKRTISDILATTLGADCDSAELLKLRM